MQHQHKTTTEEMITGRPSRLPYEAPEFEGFGCLKSITRGPDCGSVDFPIGTAGGFGCDFS